MLLLTERHIGRRFSCLAVSLVTTKIEPNYRAALAAAFEVVRAGAVSRLVLAGGRA
jgi:hypothetical protein